MSKSWALVPGYGEKYEVSSDGEVRTKATLRIRKSFSYNGQYRKVMLMRDGKPHGQYVHRLVAAAFCPRDDGANEVNHINGNKADNRAANLEWVTRRQNMRHALQNGLCATKLSFQLADEIRAAHQHGDSYPKLRARFAVSTSTISNVIRGNAWTHG